MSDWRPAYEALLRKQAQVKQAQETIAAFDKQWLENDYLVLDDLLWVMAEASPDNRKAYIEPIIQSAITSKALTVWDENKSFRLNDKVLHTQYIPRKTLVLKQDFIHWWKQEKSVPFPQRLIDLAVSENSKTKKSKIPEDALMALTTLLDEIRLRASEQGVNFDSNVMFGTKEQLHCLAKARFGGSLFEKAPTTFSDYLKNSNICKFRQGAKPSNIYEKLFPEYTAFFGARVSVVK
jgi:hypothetical protein